MNKNKQTTIHIREFIDSDFEQVAQIYQEGIDGGLATFETKVKTYEQWNAAILPHSRLVATTEQNILMGWAVLSPVSTRPVYAGVAEVTIYIKNSAQGQGVGSLLLSSLISSSEQHNIWTLKSVIFPENKPSIALHQKCGFRMVGVQEKIAKLGGQWRDNVLMERRSRVVGLN